MFIIEYLWNGELRRMAPMGDKESRAIEELLVSLPLVSVVMIWGPL